VYLGKTTLSADPNGKVKLVSENNYLFIYVKTR